MEFLGCVDDCGDLALYLDVLDCAELGDSDPAASSSNSSRKQCQAENSGGASRYRSRRRISSVTRRVSGQQVR